MSNQEYLDQVGEAEVANSETGLSLEINSLIKINKATIKEKVDAVVMSVQEGWTDPLDALILAKKGTELFTLLEKNIRPMAEAKPVGKNFRKFDCEITEGIVGAKTDYSNCGDPVYNELVEQSEKLKAEIKDREKFLAGITKPTDIVVNECEVYKINPPIKSGRMGFSLSIK